jgi:hypothetical protein
VPRALVAVVTGITLILAGPQAAHAQAAHTRAALAQAAPVHAAPTMNVAQAPKAAPAPGAPGAGDLYFPDYGNGGYDVSHYDVRLRYYPDTDKITGTTTILATSTQELSRFGLDFVLDVISVRVNNRLATFAREGAHELVVTPAVTLRPGQAMTVVVQYAGVPSEKDVNGLNAWVRTPGTGPWRSASRRSPGGGSRATTTRPTRPRSTSRWRFPTASRWSATGSCPARRCPS